MLYININTQEIRELDSNMVQMWRDTNNPKLSIWNELPPKPSDGAIWTNNEWIVPITPTPETVSARQIRLWLLQNNISLQMVNDAINNIEDTNIRDSVAIEWEYAPYIERNHPMLLPLATALGLVASDIDRAFVEAAQL